MDARRLRLYELLKPKLDEEPARELVLALPADPEELVTKSYLDNSLQSIGDRVAKELVEQSDKLTWRMITVMGGWTAVGVSLFALMSRLFE